MIPPSLIRRAAFRTAANIPTRLSSISKSTPARFIPHPQSQFRRSIHNVPFLTRSEYFSDNGIAPLFSKEGFEVAWTNYQTMLVDGLNEHVADTGLDHKPALDTALATSRRPELAAIFNYASQAHNNHFFFESLTNDPPNPPDSIFESISPYPSLEVLKDEITATALSLFGSGTVWLVLDRAYKLRLLATYNAGTPYPGAHSRLQDIDTNTLASPTQGGRGNGLLEHTTAVSRGAGGVHHWPVPILSVSMWPQVYMTDYGVSQAGRRKYLENWWASIDWTVVAGRHPGQGVKRRMVT